MSEISLQEIKKIIWTERIKVSQMVSSIVLLIMGCTLIGNNWNILYNGTALFQKNQINLYILPYDSQYQTNLILLPNQSFIWGTFFSGLMCIFVSIFGIYLANQYNSYISIVGGSVVICMLSFILALGIQMSQSIPSNYDQSYTWKNIACNNPIPGQYLPDKTQLNGNLAYKYQYAQMVNNVMCSQFCPCSTETQNYFQSISQSTLYFNNRYLYSSQQSQFIQIVFDNQYFNNYEECFNQKLTKNYNSIIQINNNIMYAYDQFVNKGGYQFLKNLEKQVGSCSGFCTQGFSPLFSLIKNVAHSMNEANYYINQDCVDSLYSTFYMHYYQIQQCSNVLIVTACIQIVFIYLQYLQFKKFKLDSSQINQQFSNLDAVNQSSQPLNKKDISLIQNSDLTTQNVNILNKEDGQDANDLDMEFQEDRNEDIENKNQSKRFNKKDYLEDRKENNKKEIKNEDQSDTVSDKEYKNSLNKNKTKKQLLIESKQKKKKLLEQQNRKKQGLEKQQKEDKNKKKKEGKSFWDKITRNKKSKVEQKDEEKPLWSQVVNFFEEEDKTSKESSKSDDQQKTDKTDKKNIKDKDSKQINKPSKQIQKQQKQKSKIDQQKLNKYKKQKDKQLEKKESLQKNQNNSKIKKVDSSSDSNFKSSDSEDKSINSDDQKQKIQENQKNQKQDMLKKKKDDSPIDKDKIKEQGFMESFLNNFKINQSNNLEDQKSKNKQKGISKYEKENSSNDSDEESSSSDDDSKDQDEKIQQNNGNKNDQKQNSQNIQKQEQSNQSLNFKNLRNQNLKNNSYQKYRQQNLQNNGQQEKKFEKNKKENQQSESDDTSSNNNRKNKGKNDANSESQSSSNEQSVTPEDIDHQNKNLNKSKSIYNQSQDQQKIYQNLNGIKSSSWFKMSRKERQQYKKNLYQKQNQN